MWRISNQLNRLKLMTIIVLVFLLSGCFKEEWEGFVYPNKNNLSNYQTIGVFDSLEQCGNSALDRLQQLHAINYGTYECGLNCEFNSNLGIKVCERTAR